MFKIEVIIIAVIMHEDELEPEANSSVSFS